MGRICRSAGLVPSFEISSPSSWTRAPGVDKAVFVYLTKASITQIFIKFLNSSDTSMDMNGGVKKISIIVQLTTSLTMSVRQSILSINFPPPFTALVREPSSVSDPSHFDVDPDPGPDPGIHIGEKWIRILGSTFP